MRLLLHDTGQIIRFNRKNLLLFHMGYRLTAAAVYLQLLNAGMRFSLGMAGYRYLTLENLGKVLLSPWTIPVIAGLLAVGLVLLMIEAGGLVAAYSGAVYSLKLPAVRILTEGIRIAAERVRRRDIGLFAVAAADFFVMNVLYLIRMLTHVKPLNFVIRELWGHPVWRAGTVLAVCICTAAVIPTYFTFHGCMIQQKFYRDSRAESMGLLRGRFLKTVARVVVPQLLVAAAAWIVYLAMVTVMAAAAVLLVRDDLEFAFLIRVSDWMEWIIMALASMTASVFFFADVTVQYYRYGRNKVGKRHFFDTGEAFFSRKNGLVILAVAGLAAGAGLIDGAVNGSFLDSSVVVQTEITAHRGSSGSAPENTMAALAAAVEEMADWAEIDVQETADGVVILCHDENLRRLTGVKRLVSETTFEEIEQLEAGSWFSEAFRGERIPSLEEAMEYAKGRLKLNIEIKYTGPDSQVPEKVVKLVEDHGMEDQCMITCASRQYLKRIKEANPHIYTGYIVPAAYGKYYMEDEIDVISIRSGFVTEKLVKAAHEAGKSVHAWTVNDKRELERMRVLAVDNVITDVPVLAREILYREEATENLLEYIRLILR